VTADAKVSAKTVDISCWSTIRFWNGVRVLPYLIQQYWVEGAGNSVYSVFPLDLRIDDSICARECGLLAIMLIMRVFVFWHIVWNVRVNRMARALTA
jgi:hypothetical protein